MLTLSAAIAALATVSVPAVPYEYRNLEIVGGGFVTGIIPHPTEPNLVYARTDIGGAYRWDEARRRWIPLMDWITRPDWNLYGVESLALDPNDPNRVLIAAGTYDNEWGGLGEMLLSSDRGRTFRRVPLPFKNGGNMPGRSIGERLMIDPGLGRIAFFGTRNDGLWRSSDGGRKWAKVPSFGEAPREKGVGVGWVVFDPATIIRGKATSRIFAGWSTALPQPIRVSEDGGVTWRADAGQPGGMIPHQAKFAPDGSMVVVYGNAIGPNDVTDGSVWRRSPQGAWTEITPEKPGEGNRFGYGGVAVDPRATGTLMVSTLCRWSKGDTVFRTTDGGRTWISLKENSRRDTSRAPYLTWGRPEADFGHWIGDVEIDPHRSDRSWYVTGAGIWASRNLTAADRGETTVWDPEAFGLEETAVIDLVSPSEGALVVSGMGDVGGFAHTSADQSPPGGIWQNPYMNTVVDVDVAALEPNVVVRAGNASQGKHIAISRDQCRTWRPFATQPEGVTGPGSIAVSADGKAVVWASEGAGVFVTLDDGVTWTRSLGVPVTVRVVSDRVNPSRFTAHDISSGRVFESLDGGNRFALRATRLVTPERRIVAVPGVEGERWVPTPTGLVRLIGDLAVPVAGVEEARMVAFGKPPRPGAFPTVFLAGQIRGVPGLFRSTDEGARWVQVNDRTQGFGTMMSLEGDARVFGRFYLGTNGRGVLMADPKGGRR